MDRKETTNHVVNIVPKEFDNLIRQMISDLPGVGYSVETIRWESPRPEEPRIGLRIKWSK